MGLRVKPRMAGRLREARSGAYCILRAAVVNSCAAVQPQLRVLPTVFGFGRTLVRDLATILSDRARSSSLWTAQITSPLSSSAAWRCPYPHSSSSLLPNPTLLLSLHGHTEWTLSLSYGTPAA